MEESKDCNVDSDIDVLFQRRRKRRKIFGGEYLFSGGKENQRKKRRKICGEDLSRTLRSLGFGEFGLEEKSRFWFWRIWSRKKSLGFGFVKFGLGNKVSVSVSENLVSEKSFGFGKFGLEKKVSISENLVSEKKSISVSKNLVSGKKSFGFGKLGLGKEKIKVTRKNLDQVNSPSLLFEI